MLPYALLLLLTLCAADITIPPTPPAGSPHIRLQVQSQPGLTPPTGYLQLNSYLAFSYATSLDTATIFTYDPTTGALYYPYASFTAHWGIVATPYIGSQGAPYVMLKDSTQVGSAYSRAALLCTGEPLVCVNEGLIGPSYTYSYNAFVICAEQSDYLVTFDSSVQSPSEPNGFIVDSNIIVILYQLSVNIKLFINCSLHLTACWGFDRRELSIYYEGFFVVHNIIVSLYQLSVNIQLFRHGRLVIFVNNTDAGH